MLRKLIWIVYVKMSHSGFLVRSLIIQYKNNKMKKRKDIERRVVKVQLEGNSRGHSDTSENSLYPILELGQVVPTFIQSSTRMLYETFGKESECSNNKRQHYRCDGKSKVPFDSLDEAKSACTRLWDENEDMRPYKCSTCGKFHIGHKRGEKHSIPYKFYKGGEVLGLLIDLCFSIRELFYDDYCADSHPKYNVNAKYR